MRRLFDRWRREWGSRWVGGQRQPAEEWAADELAEGKAGKLPWEGGRRYVEGLEGFEVHFESMAVLVDLLREKRLFDEGVKFKVFAICFKQLSSRFQVAEQLDPNSRVATDVLGVVANVDSVVFGPTSKQD